MSKRQFDYGATIASSFDEIINGTTHGRQVPRCPTMDEADENYVREKSDRRYYTGRSYLLSRRRKPASKL
jgi:hypothetical protein